MGVQPRALSLYCSPLINPHSFWGMSELNSIVGVNEDVLFWMNIVDGRWLHLSMDENNVITHQIITID
jgi:hypothetical protein